MPAKLAAAALALAALTLSACGDFGKVEQGRVIAYNHQTGVVTLIRDSTSGKEARPHYDALPPLTVGIPEDPAEMGAEPLAGKLAKVDVKNRQITFFDAAAQQFRTIEYVPVEERSGVAKAPSGSPVNRKLKTISVYAAAEKMLITFAASDELLALLDDTWKMGDEVRYYYKDPSRALRMMNVSKTDFNKAGG